MPKEIFPSSFLCDCGHQSHFFENPVREIKAMSEKRRVCLGDSVEDQHTIVFHRGEMVGILCPARGEGLRPSPADAAKGTIVIPSALRRKYGLVPGSIVDVEDREREIVVTVRLAYKQGRGMLSGGSSLTADLLAERASDREREEEP